MISDSDEDDVAITEKYVKNNDALKRFGWADLPLRHYQLSGVNWLVDCTKKGHGAILGDEMGLGKTCQTIAFLTYLKKSNQHSLVVCPRSVLENWGEEFHRFSPSLKIQTYVGDKDKRHELASNIKRDLKKGREPFDILLTTYELCLKDDAFFSSIPWRVIVVDEAHRLKNSESLLYQTLSDWDIDYRVLLTGTPVQNNLSELYSLLSFVAPRIFRLSGQEKFVNKYKDVAKNKGKSELHEVLQPYLLRRTKEAVLKDLPKKSEIVMYHGISKVQKKLYKAILTKDISVFADTNRPGGGSPRLMNILMQLRKCVNHPYLFDGVEPEPFELGEHLVEASGKLILIDQLLNYLQSNGHKVLLFSQMTHMLDILQDYLGYREYSYERLDGSVRGEERFLAVQNFNKNTETFVFLLSTKAGGQGLNLVSADTVIFVDSDFNPQNDLQAAARAHRIGQTRPVKIIRLVGRNTVEEIILKRAEDKLKLTEKVIEEGEFSLGLSKQSLIADQHVPLQDILKFGVDTLLNDDDATDSNIDFAKILGPSVSGEWQLEEEASASVEQKDDVELEEAPSSMYEFEGVDYTKEPSAADKKAFEDLLSTEQLIVEEDYSGERSLRKKSVMFSPLTETSRRAKTQLTPEEIEERNRKRKETLERKAKEAEERAKKRAEQQRKKLEELWTANSYVSSCVTFDSDDEGSEDEEKDSRLKLDEEEDDGGQKSHAIHYVSGDVTHPVQTKTGVNLVVHCADDSGWWGKGGVFTAISKRSRSVEEQYELAAKMKDIRVGDCHLISMDDKSGSGDVEDWMCLIIAQHRDKKNNSLTGIKLSALRDGLKMVYKLAKARKASVHLPRIGHDTPGFNWYGTERLIRKHLSARGVPTYIYYYPRKQKGVKRKSEDTPSNSKFLAKKSTASSISSTNGCTSSKLLDIFTRKCIYLHPSNLKPDRLRQYRRKIIAYDGDVAKEFTSEVTHVVADPKCEKAAAVWLKSTVKCPIVTVDWLDCCLQRRRLVPVQSYIHPACDST
ncbi:chromodomain-helicase-DNA-binding protein 1-like isoform X1 [Ostrea edulis]|uniref:chromodomain-helicase-DNA-binding protein 1-like isoform X1 n=2 Tax=Ostrea edulis TaxID=37623 RepID=UPI0024AF6763|nr:chromodomain-helicase-DNA-binding protein 1-like isoform X1 [Ostrea edulis]